MAVVVAEVIGAGVVDLGDTKVSECQHKGHESLRLIFFRFQIAQTRLLVLTLNYMLNIVVSN